MPRRIESPSSINTFKQCPRKYYYHYVEGLPSKPSIHLIRGSVAHLVLEKFFEEKLEMNDENYENVIRNKLQENLVKEWKEHKNQFDELKLTEQQLSFYFDETMMMILNFADHLLRRMNEIMAKGYSLNMSFMKVTPLAEEKFESKKYSVRGFIDAIEKRDGKTYIMDYKTSKNSKINDAYRLQLSIYAMMYQERFGILPEKVGIFFLKDIEMFLDVDEDMVKDAKFEIEQMHASTESDKKVDYVMKPSGLCKWSTGQCDYFDLCFPNGRY